MTVEIGDGRRDTIEVADDDEPELLSRTFCKKHNLPGNFVAVLTRQIEDNLEVILKEGIQHKADDWAEESAVSSGEGSKMSDFPTEVSSADTLSAQFQALASDSSRVSQSSRCSVNSSAGERLYYLGVIKKEMNAHWRDKQVQRQDEQTSKELTFKPAINSRSKSLAKNHRRAEDSYMEQQRKRLEGLERKKGLSLAEQQSECTFVPKVNSNSQAMARSRSTHRSAFVNLYSEAQDRQVRHQEAKDSVLKAQCPFKPTINSQRMRSIQDRPLVDRLVNSRAMVESSLQRIRDEQSALIDPATGQAFFKPKIGRAPRLDRNSENLPIGAYLYSQSSKDSSRLQDPSTAIELLSRQRSTQIIEKLKMERFRELFELLNPDENQAIASTRIEPEKLSAELLTVLFPLLEELEQLNEPINFAEFSEAMDNLLTTLTPGDKSMILVPRRAAVAVEEPTHQPQINEFRPSTYKQRQLAKLTLYERMNFLAQDKQRRIEEAKTKKQRVELEQCTFHPKIKTYRLAEDSIEETSESYFVRPLLR
jgi:hypothetical protein